MAAEYVKESWNRLDAVAVAKYELMKSLEDELAVLPRKDNTGLMEQIDQVNALLEDILTKLRYPPGMVRPDSGHAALLAMIRSALNGGSNLLDPDASDNEEVNAHLTDFVRESFAEKRVWEPESVSTSESTGEDDVETAADRAFTVGEMNLGESSADAQMTELMSEHNATKRAYDLEEAGRPESTEEDDVGPPAKRARSDPDIATSSTSTQPRRSDSFAPLRKPTTQMPWMSYNWDFGGRGTFHIRDIFKRQKLGCWHPNLASRVAASAAWFAECMNQRPLVGIPKPRGPARRNAGTAGSGQETVTSREARRKAAGESLAVEHLVRLYR